MIQKVRLKFNIVLLGVFISLHSFTQPSYDGKVDYFNKYYLAIDTSSMESYPMILNSLISDSTKIEIAGSKYSTLEYIVIDFGIGRNIKPEQIQFLSFLLRQPNLPVEQYNSKGLIFFLNEDIFSLKKLISEQEQKKSDLSYLKCLELGLEISEYKFSDNVKVFYNQLEQFYQKYDNILRMNGRLKSSIPMNLLIIEMFERTDINYSKFSLKFIREHKWRPSVKINLEEFSLFLKRRESNDFKLIRDYRSLILSN